MNRMRGQWQRSWSWTSWTTERPARSGKSLSGRDMVSIRSRFRFRPPMQPSFLPNICRKIRPENLLLFLTMLSVVFGTVLGVTLNPTFTGRELTKREKLYLGFPGDMLMRLLKIMIIPMVVASNVSSIASLNSKASRWLAALSIAYYVITSVIAVLLGTILVLIIRPGQHRRELSKSKLNSNLESDNIDESIQEKGSLKLLDAVLELIRNLVPENIVTATFRQDKINWMSNNATMSCKNISANDSCKPVTKEETDAEKYTQGTNILGLICFSIMLGIAVRNLGHEAAVLADLFHGLRRVMVYLVSIIMWISPIGILSLIAEQIAKEHELLESLSLLSLYVATVMTGLFIHGVFILPFLLYIFTRRNPVKFSGNMLQALMCAAGTASSTATLPCTVRCLESGNNVDPRVTRFMLPLGTTINMDGTVMYEAIAVIYIAQRLGIDLSIGDILMIDLSATLAGMAASSMPSAGVATMTMVLMSVGISAGRVNLILAVDWFLDRFRTMVNVFGDAIGAAIVSKLCEAKLAREGSIDPSLLPDPEESLLQCPNGFKDVNLRNLDTAGMDIERELSSPISLKKMNGDIILRRSSHPELFLNAIEPHLLNQVPAPNLPQSASQYQQDSSTMPSANTTNRLRQFPSIGAGPKYSVPDYHSAPHQTSSSTCVYVVDEDTVVLKF